jgi:hypothetical protein
VDEVERRAGQRLVARDVVDAGVEVLEASDVEVGGEDRGAATEEPATDGPAPAPTSGSWWRSRRASRRRSMSSSRGRR